MLFPKTSTSKTWAQTHKIIYGHAKTGKTTLSAQQTDGEKEPLFIATEDGEGELKISKARIRDWQGFRKLLDLLESKSEQIKTEHSCLVVDLVSDLDSWCANYTAKQNGVSDISDMDFGKGFKLNHNEFTTQMSRLLAIMPVTFISHTAEKKVTYQGKTIEVQTPMLSTKNSEWLLGKVDTVIFIRPQHGELAAALVIKPSTLALTGSRYPQLIGEHDFANPKQANDKLNNLMSKEAKNV